MFNWDMFVIWIGVNVNNGMWYVGGVLVVCGLLMVFKVIVVLFMLLYLCLLLVGFMGYKIGVVMMSLICGFFGVWGSYVLFFVNLI